MEFWPQKIVGDGTTLDFVEDEDDEDSTHPPQYLPVEFYMREIFDFDVDDPISCIEFVNTWGPAVRFPFLQLLSDDREKNLLKQRRRARKFFGFSNSAPDGYMPTANCIGDVQWTIRLLRALVNHWNYFVNDSGDVESAWIEQDLHSYDPKFPYEMAWLNFAVVMNQGLRASQPHILLNIDFGQGEPADFRGAYFFDAACTQLFNAMHEGIDLKICANETCGRTFRRQRGGAVQGQHRTKGVSYCTVACARAQAERERRRRNRTKETK